MLILWDEINDESKYTQLHQEIEINIDLFKENQKVIDVTPESRDNAI